MELDGGQEYYLKPMNCPFHILVYRSHQRSYRELPMRLFEFGSVYRYELSGVLQGLTRVRGMTQDDAHIFCTPEQMDAELVRTLTFVLDLLRDYGLAEFYLELSTKPPGKGVGSDEEWEVATQALLRTALEMGLELVMDEGGGAFYGPKISVQARDAIGRTWQLSTVQLDFQLPRRFGLEYVGADNARHRPIMIHRALFGSVERFLAVLIEHYAGALPTWLCPEQVRVIPVTDAHLEYAKSVADACEEAGLRATVDASGEKMGALIRRAKLAKIPYVLVVGDKDVAAGSVGVNRRGWDAKPEFGVPVETLVSEVGAEVERKGLPEDRAPHEGVVSLEHLWAGWRRPYIVEATARERAGTDEGCVFCELAASGPPSEENLVVWRGELTFVVMNAYPYASGHVLVLPLRHVGSLAGLTEPESAELWSATQRAVASIEAAYEPDGLNMGANLGRAAGAGLPAHVHLHVLPRWSGDTNFMTAVAETRVLPETLQLSWKRLADAWPG